MLSTLLSEDLAVQPVIIIPIKTNGYIFLQKFFFNFLSSFYWANYKSVRYLDVNFKNYINCLLYRANLYLPFIDSMESKIMNIKDLNEPK